MKIQEYDVPPTLLALIEFEKTLGSTVDYAEGFELQLDSERGPLWTYGERVCKEFIGFARATYSGSSYAFWIKDGNRDLEQAPIVFFGDEGANGLAATNLRQLLSMLSCDHEGYVYGDDGSVYFGEEESEQDEKKADEDEDDYEDDYDEREPSKDIEAFRRWLTESQNIEVLNCTQASELAKQVAENASKELNEYIDSIAEIR